MREPNFSESQLQQAANTAFIRKIFEHHGSWAFAHVPSLIAEFDLGWDTAFHFPWLPYLPSADDEGCNFFLQYKLSVELTSPGAKEWSQWRESFFRFKIPHGTCDASGCLVDDYHQWHRLKALAGKNYPTFYATNSTLSKTELQNSLAAGSLLDHVPLLDVRTITKEHKHVTFTPRSQFFLLHSKQEDANKRSFTSTLGLLAEGRQSSLMASTENLLKILKGFEGTEERWNRDLARISSTIPQDLPRHIKAWGMQAFLASFVRKHIGADLFWLPRLR